MRNVRDYDPPKDYHRVATVPHIAYAQTQTVYGIRLWLVLTHNVGLFNVIFNNVVNGLNVNIWGLS